MAYAGSGEQLARACESENKQKVKVVSSLRNITLELSGRCRNEQQSTATDPQRSA